MLKYAKAWSALAAGVVVAIPSILAASSDGHITTAEWIQIVGLLVPAIAVALSPANGLTDVQLVQQVLASKNVNDILARLHVSPANLLRALQEGIQKVSPQAPPTTTAPGIVITDRKPQQ